MLSCKLPIFVLTVNNLFDKWHLNRKSAIIPTLAMSSFVPCLHPSLLFPQHFKTNPIWREKGSILGKWGISTATKSDHRTGWPSSHCSTSLFKIESIKEKNGLIG